MNKILVIVAIVLLCSSIPATKGFGFQTKSDATASAVLVYSADGSPLPNVHEVVGRVKVTARNPATIRLTGHATFSSADTYYCTATVSSSVRYVIGVHVINKDGSNFIIEADAAPSGETVTYRCLGA